MQERFTGNPDEDFSRNSDSNTELEIDYSEIRDLLLAWLEVILENPKNQEIIYKLHEIEYNRKTNIGE